MKTIQIIAKMIFHTNKVTKYTFINFHLKLKHIISTKKHYIQIKGCPKGIHFSPPFAIIFMYMYSIENAALKITRCLLHQSFTLCSLSWWDHYMGPFDKKTHLQLFLTTFNSINKNIQFTLEIPKNNALNILDISNYFSKK